MLCGFGPTVEVGGRTVQTKIVGDLSEVVTGAELTVVACDDEPIPVGPGRQRIRVTNGDGFAVSRLWLEPAVPAVAPVASGADVRVVSWSATERTIAVSTDRDAVLTVSQSENLGWQAHLDGEVLDRVVVDGWKQAWRIPAGSTGEVTLSFTPQSSFLNGIVFGLVLAALLNVAALVMLVVYRRRTIRHRATRHRPGATLAPGPHRVVVAVGSGVLALVSLPLALGALGGYVARRRSIAEMSAVCASLLVVAAAISMVDVATIITPPPAADVITAAVVGLVAGRVFFGGARTEEDES